MIHFFVGTKAQLIKVAPIMRTLQDRSIEYNYIHSGQHQDTLDDILDNFHLTMKPNVILHQGDDITGITQMAGWASRIFKNFGSDKSLSRIFRNDKQGVVINHGDTVSTLLGSYLAKKQGLKSAHVESGLRSFNIFHPFPEELTRLLTFRLSDYFFAPGSWALQNLAKYPGKKVDTFQNTLYDSLSYTTTSGIEIPREPYAIISIHRFENIFSKKRFSYILDAILASKDNTRKLFILHKPTEKKLHQYGLYEKLKNHDEIELRPRYDYFKFISLLKSAEYLISDGGSNQEECFYLGKPCLLMRKATERKEGIGHNVVLSRYDEAVIHEFMLNYSNFAKEPLVLHDRPSDIIVETLVNDDLVN